MSGMTVPLFAVPLFAVPLFAEPLFAEPLTAEPLFAVPVLAESLLVFFLVTCEHLSEMRGRSLTQCTHIGVNHGE